MMSGWVGSCRRVHYKSFVGLKVPFRTKCGESKETARSPEERAAHSAIQLVLKMDTAWFRSSANCASDWAVAAVSSLLAAACSVVAEMLSTATITSEVWADCSSLAAAISATLEAVSLTMLMMFSKASPV